MDKRTNITNAGKILELSKNRENWGVQELDHRWQSVIAEDSRLRGEGEEKKNPLGLVRMMAGRTDQGNKMTFREECWVSEKEWRLKNSMRTEH